MSDDQTPHSLREQVRSARLRLADSAADLGTLLPAAGGVHGTATGADRGGAVVGTSATAPTDPSTPDGSYHATLWTLGKS